VIYCYILISLFGIILAFVIIRKSKIQRTTYSDGLFYKPNIDINYYFIKRLDLKPEKEEDDNEKDENDITNNEEAANTSKELNVETQEKRADQNNVLTLAENKRTKLENNGITDNCVIENNIENIQTNVSIDTQYKYVTYLDYSKIPKDVLFSYDKRAFLKYVGDELVQHHSLMKIFIKDSILDPGVISLLKLLFRINLIFSINAFTLTDDFIERRAYDITRVSLIITIE
jgi:hypothetical protein